MLSFSSFIFSWRMRLSKLKKHKLATFLCLLAVVGIIAFSIPAYQESWLDPFSTLNIPDRVLHPHWITKVGMVTSKDPFHPHYCQDEEKIQALIRNLRTATPLSAGTASFSSKNQTIDYFTLHRTASDYHKHEDYALQYFPGKQVIFFEQQYYKINQITVNSIDQLQNSMISGWWK